MTNSASIDGKRRMLVTFDQYNKDMLLHTLERYLQQGYMLSYAHGFFGVLTFEPLPPIQSREDVKYAVVRRELYTDGFPEARDWKMCGSIGDHTVYRSVGRADPAEFPQPDRSPVRAEFGRRLYYIVLGLLWFGQFIMRLKMPESSKNYKALLLVLMVNAAVSMYKGLKIVNRHSTRHGGFIYFSQYVLWRIIAVMGIAAILIYIS